MTPTLVTPALLREWPLPSADSEKDARGCVLVIGGAARTPGGVALAGLAALRCGAGKVQLALAGSVAAAQAVAFPEVGVLPLEESAGGSVLGEPAAARCAEIVGDVDAVLVGPGLDDPEEAEALLRALLPEVPGDVALVLDAFALGVLPAVRDLLRGREVAPVLTPNGSELARLVDDDAEDPVGGASASYGACVTCRDDIADAGGERWQVPSGHPGLATAGSGDVLAGLVAGLLSRGAEPAQAACWATYLHSTAGERLASQVGELGFLARELVDQVPALLSELG